MAHRAQHIRPPRGGFWNVSLCIGNDRWKTLPWVGSHAEADYIADNYRRRCRRAAVHREGQPPRERVASVLPASYRPPRDRESIQKLLTDFARANNNATAHSTAIVLEDALLEEGFDWAAHDLREFMNLGCQSRSKIAERILSEVLNGATVLEHGEWYFPPNARRPRLHPYVLILERLPTHYSQWVRKRDRGQPRIVLWRRYGSRRGHCGWGIYDVYDLNEFDSLEEAEAQARRDIANEKLEPRYRRSFSEDEMLQQWGSVEDD